MTEYRVALHVYDLSRGMARQMSASLLGMHIEGVWHTGVVVYGLEFFFGGGIQAVPPAQVAETYGNPYQVIEMGNTQVPQSEFIAFLQEIQPRFTAATYNLLSNNCNNFSNEVANFLLGENIPQHILELPERVLSTPMGAMFRPMVEELQGRMAQNIQMHHNPSPLNNIAPPVIAQKSLKDYKQTFISSLPETYVDKIVARISSLSPSESEAIDRLVKFTKDGDISALTPQD
ncbi:PPPDE peptidase domain-containing protein, partial [Thraustotheca clavata]